MSTTLNYASTVRSPGAANLATANTNRDGSGTIATVFSAGASGSRVERISVKRASTATAGNIVRVYVSDGTNHRLYHEFTFPSATAASGTVPTLDDELVLDDLTLASGSSIRASVHTGETGGINIFVHGSDF